MACSGGHCTNHGTWFSTCVGHRPAYSSASPLMTGVTRGNTIRYEDINNLRAAIKQEVDRWRLHSWYSGSVNSTGLDVIPRGTVADDDQYNIMDDKVHNVYARGALPHGYAAKGPTSLPSGLTVDVATALIDIVKTEGDFIKIEDYNSLVAQYNALREDCICNSDCSCNAVCSCHNDCGCHYSDRRLKKEIQYC